MLMLTLFVAGLFAGAVDAIAGGGGLISIPVLLSIGLPPHMAFGTNKLQGAIGTCVATKRYWREGWVSFKSIYQGLLAGFIGACVGAVANQWLSSKLLLSLAPVLLMVTFLYTVFSPHLGRDDIEPKLKSWIFYSVFGFVLGFYDGFFGPGTGAFWVFLLMFFLGFNLLKATAYTKVLNLNSNLIALVCFAMDSHVNYKIGLCMAAGQVIGGWLGAGLAIRNGVRLIRPLFLVVVFLTITTLGIRSYGNSLVGVMVLNFKTTAIFSALLAVCCIAALIVTKFHHHHGQHKI